MNIKVEGQFSTNDLGLESVHLKGGQWHSSNILNVPGSGRSDYKRTQVFHWVPFVGNTWVFLSDTLTYQQCPHRVITLERVPALLRNFQQDTCSWILLDLRTYWRWVIQSHTEQYSMYKSRLRVKRGCKPRAPKDKKKFIEESWRIQVNLKIREAISHEDKQPLGIMTQLFHFWVFIEENWKPLASKRCSQHLCSWRAEAGNGHGSESSQRVHKARHCSGQEEELQRWSLEAAAATRGGLCPSPGTPM